MRRLALALVGGDAVDVLLGDGAGGFVRAPGAPLRGPLAAEEFAFGDLDVVTDSWPDSRLVLVRGRGDGTFELPILNLRTGDLTGDGRASSPCSAAAPTVFGEP